MPPPETYKKSEMGSQSRYDMPGPYLCIRLSTRAGETDYTACHPRKTTTYIYVTRSTHHYAYARQTQVTWKKETKKRKLDKGTGQERQESEGNNRKSKKKSKKRRDKRKQRKEKSKKNHTSRPSSGVSSASSMALGGERIKAKKSDRRYGNL